MLIKVRGLRWWVIGLIVLITIINYLDRNTLAIMWQGMVESLGLIDPEGLTEDEYKTQTKELYAYINMFFMVGASLVPLSMISILFFGGKIEQQK